MRTDKLVLIALIASSSGFAMADSSVNYRFSGDTVGRQVCRAIVNDDVKRLDQVLRFHRSSLTYAYSIRNTASDAIKRNFKCKDVKLEDFSYRVGAENVMAYLASGNKSLEEQVVVNEK